MSFLIAVATSDGQKMDLHFAEAENYNIYKVDGLSYSFLQKREYVFKEDECGENFNGCCAKGEAKVQLLKDCRCVIAAQAGFNIKKEFSKLGISFFDELDCSVEKAIKAIAEYFYKLDEHIVLTKKI